jgi:hypothetical protein
MQVDVQKTACYNVGLNSLTYSNSTNPCGIYSFCNGKPVGFEPKSLDCGWYDDPSDCRIENCYCTQTGQIAQSTLHDYVGLYVEKDECAVYGKCPQGGSQIAPQGSYGHEYDVYYDPSCNCFGCQDFEYCDLGTYGSFYTNVSQAGLQIELTQSHNCGKDECLWTFYCDGTETASGCGPCVGGGLKLNGNKYTVGDFNMDSLTMGQIFTSLKNSKLNNSKILMPINSDFNIILSDYMKIVKSLDTIWVNSIDKSELPDSSTCSKKCKLILVDGEGSKDRSIEPTETDIIIAPNPFIDQIEIQITSQYTGSLNINLVNMLGETVFSKYFEIKVGVNKLNIQTKTLPLGTYIIQIEDNTGYLTSKRLIHLSNN